MGSSQIDDLERRLEQQADVFLGRSQLVNNRQYLKRQRCLD